MPTPQSSREKSLVRNWESPRGWGWGLLWPERPGGWGRGGRGRARASGRSGGPSPGKLREAEPPRPARTPADTPRPAADRLPDHFPPLFRGSLLLPLLSKASANLPDTGRRSEGGPKPARSPTSLHGNHPVRRERRVLRAAGARGGRSAARPAGRSPPRPLGPRGAGGRTGARCRQPSLVLAPAVPCRRRLPLLCP